MLTKIDSSQFQEIFTHEEAIRIAENKVTWGRASAKKITGDHYVTDKIMNPAEHALKNGAAGFLSVFTLASPLVLTEALFSPHERLAVIKESAIGLLPLSVFGGSFSALMGYRRAILHNRRVEEDIRCLPAGIEKQHEILKPEVKNHFYQAQSYLRLLR